MKNRHPFTRIRADGSYDYGITGIMRDRVLGQASTQQDAYRGLISAFGRMRQTVLYLGIGLAEIGAALIVYSRFGLGTGLARVLLPISLAGGLYVTGIAVRMALRK